MVLKHWRHPLSGLILLVLYAAIIHKLVFHTEQPFYSAPDVEPVKSVRVFQGNPYNQRDSWESSNLPTDWALEEIQSSEVWYQGNITANPGTDGIWALYIPKVTHRVTAWVNGVWVGQSGDRLTPLSRHHNDPQLFSFSAALLNTGANQIELRVQAAHPVQGFLSEIYLAPHDQLVDAWFWKSFWRIQFVEWMTLLMFILSPVILLFWLARPQDHIYGIFSLELFFWALHNLNLFVTEIPVSARLWEAMTMSTLGWTVVTMIFFNHRFVGDRRVWVEKTLLVVAALGLIPFVLSDIGLILVWGYRAWDAALLLIGIYAIYHLGKIYWHKPQLDVYLMLLVGIPILSSGLHDILMVNGFLDRQQGLIIQYSVIPAVTLFSWFLIRRFIRSINQAEDLAANLEQRVIEGKLQIHQQYEQLKSMEHQQLLAEERERIMRDMHDGIGGQLVGIVSFLQAQSGEVFGRVRERIEHSLLDLRFVIDSLDPLQQDLTTLLATMRFRMQDMLDASSIKLEWDVSELPDDIEMTPARSLHILRIIQEAITNSVKHSGTDRITLRTAVDPQQEDKVVIELIDYGKGIGEPDDSIKSRGHGLNNMTYRASQIGAELTIDSGSGGTQVTLQLVNQNSPE